MPPSSSMALAHPGAPLAAVVFPDRAPPCRLSSLSCRQHMGSLVGLPQVWHRGGKLCPVPRPLALLGLAPGGYPQVKLKGIAPGFRESPPALLRKERWWCGSW